MQKRCKCGKMIEFGRLPDGGTVPLDLSVPIYHISRTTAVSTGQEVINLHRAAKGELGLNHFATCANANEYSQAIKVDIQRMKAALELLLNIERSVPPGQAITIAQVKRIAAHGLGLPNPEAGK